MSVKSLNQYLRVIEKAGWLVEHTKKGIKIRTSWGQLFMTSKTPSDSNSHKALQKSIKKYATQPVPEEILK